MRRLWSLCVALLIAALAVPLSAKDWTSSTFTITTNGQCVQIDAGGMGTASWEITGTWTGTISMYVRGQNNTANALDVSKADTPSTFVNSTTANGIWSGPVASYKYAVACATAAMTGTAIVQLSAAGTGGGSGGGGGGGGGVVEGMGTLGTPAGGVLTVQGGTGGTDLPTLEDPASTLTVNTGATATNTAAILAAMNPDQVRDVAISATAAGPLLVGLGSTVTPTTMSADNDATAVWVDLNGRLHLVTEAVEDAAETAAGFLTRMGAVQRNVAASSAGTTGDNATINVDTLGLLWARFLDPCSGVDKITVPISVSSATTTVLAAASASNKLYVCGMNLVVSAADNIALVEDASGSCASPDAGMAGGTTSGTGWNLAANGGIVFGSGLGTVAKTASTNVNVCIITSSTAQASGTFVYALAP